MMIVIKKDQIINLLKNSLNHYNVDLLQSNYAEKLRISDDNVLQNIDAFFLQHLATLNKQLFYSMNITEKNNVLVIEDGDFQKLVVLKTLFAGYDLMLEIEADNLHLLKKYDIKYQIIEMSDIGHNICKINNVINITPIYYKVTKKEEVANNVDLEEELDDAIIMMENNFTTTKTPQAIQKYMVESLYQKNILLKILPSLSEEKHIELLNTYGVMYYLIIQEVKNIYRTKIKSFEDNEIKRIYTLNKICSTLGKEINKNKYLDLVSSKNEGKRYFMYSLICKNMNIIYQVTNEFKDIYDFLQYLEKEKFINKINEYLYDNGRLNYENNVNVDICEKYNNNISIFIARYFYEKYKKFPLPKMQNVIKSLFVKKIIYQLNELLIYEQKQAEKMRDDFLLYFIQINDKKVMDYLVKKIYENNTDYDTENMYKFIFNNHYCVEEKKKFLTHIAKKNINNLLLPEVLTFSNYNDIYEKYLENEITLSEKNDYQQGCTKFLYSFISKIFLRFKTYNDWKENKEIINKLLMKFFDFNIPIQQNFIVPLIIKLSGYVNYENKINQEIDEIEDFTTMSLSKSFNDNMDNGYYSFIDQSVTQNFTANNLDFIKENKQFIINLIERLDNDIEYNCNPKGNELLSNVISNCILHIFNYEEILKLKKYGLISFLTKNTTQDFSFEKYICENVRDVMEKSENEIFEHKNGYRKNLILKNYLLTLLIRNNENNYKLSEEQILSILELFKYNLRDVLIPNLTDRIYNVNIIPIIDVAFKYNIPLKISFSYDFNVEEIIEDLKSDKYDDKYRDFAISVIFDSMIEKVVNYNGYYTQYPLIVKAVELFNMPLNYYQFMKIIEKIGKQNFNEAILNQIFNLGKFLLTLEEREEFRNKMLYGEEKKEQKSIIIYNEIQALVKEKILKKKINIDECKNMNKKKI